MPNYNQINEQSIGPLNEVQPIELPEGSLIRSSSELEQLVEGPALLACQTLYNDNIRTISASANSKDIDEAYIDIDFSSLSEENKAIALANGVPVVLEGTASDQDPQPKAVKLAIGLDLTDNPVTVSEKLQDLALRFKKQELLWAPRYSIDQLKSIYGYSKEEPVSVEDFEQEGFYYDPASQQFHLSQELYEKSREIIGQT
ncbi:MAG TPA: hypothetical protein VFN31_00590 [Candidatus Saccharimonadales bacterium]|nr:hypothetical protein [Candidatus Saccharimonadales bacterium]